MVVESLFSNASAQSENVDRLSISNLHLDNGILAPYVFGERKQQPATVSISLDLSQGFSSAAHTDALDHNTIHYGNLAKAIRDKRPERQTLEDLVGWVEGAVDRMQERKDGSSRVGRCVVSVKLPKASMAGECVEVTSERTPRVGRVVKAGLMAVRTMVLIGVNSVERTARQPLEVDLEVSCRGKGALENDFSAFGLEMEMVGIIEPTTFETLESLGEHVVKHLQPKIQEALPSSYMMSLTMRKPKAIAFAEAPVVSLTRALPQAPQEVEASGVAGGEGGGKLRLIKPYG